MRTTSNTTTKMTKTTTIEPIAGEYENLVLVLVSCPEHGSRIVVRPLHWRQRLGDDVLITLAELPVGLGMAIVHGGRA